MAEEVGFEPTVPKGHNSFQDCRLQPLGHSSACELGRAYVCGLHDQLQKKVYSTSHKI